MSCFRVFLTGLAILVILGITALTHLPLAEAQEDVLPPQYAPKKLDDIREQTFFALTKVNGQPIYSEIKIGLDSLFTIYIGKDGNSKKIKCRKIRMNEDLSFSAKCQHTASGNFPRIDTSLTINNRPKSVELYFIHKSLKNEYDPGSNITVSTADFYSSWYKNKMAVLEAERAVKVEKKRKEEAAKRVQEEAERAANAEQKRKEEAALAEAKRVSDLDLSTVAGARLFLDDLKNFVSLDPTALDPVTLSVSYSPAVQEVKANTFNKPGSKFLELVAYTGQSEAFVAYHAAENESRYAAELEEKGRILESIRADVGKVEARLKADPLASDAYQLGQLITKFRAVPDSSLAQLRKIRSSLEQDLRVLGIASEAEKAEAKRLAAEKERLAAEAERVRLEAELAALKASPQDYLKIEFSALGDDQRKSVQAHLKDHGYYRSTLDGLWGSGTRAAIEDYARSNNSPDLMTADGARETLALIIALPQETTTAAPTTAQNKVPDLDVDNIVNARLFLEDLKNFVSLNPTALDPVTFSMSYGPAVQEVEAKTFDKPGSKFLELVAYIRQSEAFIDYHAVENESRHAAALEEKAGIRESIRADVGKVEARLQADPLAPDAYQLGQLITKFRAVPDSSLAQLRKIRGSLEQDLAALGITNLADSSEGASSGATSKIITQAELEDFVDIGPNDIAVLVNLSKDAPHAYLDLSKNIVFSDRLVNACAPSLSSIPSQYRTFYDWQVSKALPGHEITYRDACTDGFSGIDALIVTGTDLAKSQQIPSAAALVSATQGAKLKRLFVVEEKQFQTEVAKRSIVADQYATEIQEEARLGYGAIAFDSETPIGCVVMEDNTMGHDQALAEIAKALKFHSGVVLRDFVRLPTPDAAFLQAQKGKCALIYASAKTLKAILGGSEQVKLSATVLPYWATPAVIARRAKEIASLQASQEQDTGKRRSELEAEQKEEELKAQAQAQQLETRQSEYRRKNGPKVESLVSGIDSDLGEVRDEIDAAIENKQNPSSIVANFDYLRELPQWYADTRMKGWNFERAKAKAKDYGIALWGKDKRALEMVTAEILIKMANPWKGEYKDTCWYIGYIDDAEFGIRREYYADTCDKEAEHASWQRQHGFETQWDLGVQ